MKRPIVLFVWLLCLGGCRTQAAALPYDAWYLGFLAPNYMEVWLEQASVSDVNGRIFPRAMSGTVALGAPASLSASAVGWPKKIGSGKGRYMNSLDLPLYVSLRWQSLVEPQTYHALLIIPDWAREKMVERLPAHCPASGRTYDYRESLTIGLAPGGIVKVWIKGPCLDPLEVLKVQAEVEPQGPYEGKMDGTYALPLSDETKAYIDKYGIPYGSW
jgi:hypothetical protein